LALLLVCGVLVLLVLLRAELGLVLLVLVIFVPGDAAADRAEDAMVHCMSGDGPGRAACKAADADYSSCRECNKQT